MSRIKKVLVFPKTITTNEKINITSLTMAMGEITKDQIFINTAVDMANSLYSKSRERALRRANALLAVLRSHA